MFFCSLDWFDSVIEKIGEVIYDLLLLLFRLGIVLVQF